MNEHGKMRPHMRLSRLSRQILMQYLLSVVGFVAGLLLLYLLSWGFFTRFTWQGSDPVYQVLKLLQETSLIWMPILIAIGIVWITYRFLSRPLHYLEEVVQAAEQLAQPERGPVELSEALKSVQDELNLVREQALRSANAAREAEQRKNDLIVYLAHDLKTPLTSVIGYLTLLQDEPEISAALRAKYTGIALNKAERLEELINEFFEITRFNLTHLTLETESVNLTRMLEQITYEFRPALAEKGLQIDTRLEPGVELLCDPDKLERVFDNLLRNAVNYSYPDSHILVSMARRGDRAVVQVQNHGKTIPPEKLERIFEQFFRLDSSRGSKSGGAGLGLAIAREIVELHHGTIHADSRSETVAFTVTLPGAVRKL